jgi:hypothetical protein
MSGGGYNNSGIKITPGKMAAQTVTVVSLTDPTPAYIGQPGRDASGNNYHAIALTGTMWELDTNNTIKLIYDVGAIKFTWDSTNKILTWDGILFIFNGAKSSYIKLAAGSIDLSSLSYSAFVYLIAPLTFLTGGTCSTTFTTADLVIKEFNAADVDQLNPSNIPIFFFNHNYKSINSPFLNSSLSKNYLNGNFNIDKFWFVGDNAIITTDLSTRTISWIGNIFIVNHLGGYGRLPASTITLGTNEFAYTSFDPNVSGNQGTLTITIGPTTWDASSQTILRLESNILLAISGGTSNNGFNSPLLAITSNCESTKSQDKLFYTTRGKITFKADTKIITWTDRLYLFNGKHYSYCEAGSLDISSCTGTTGGFWEIYYVASSDFINGTDNDSIGSIQMKQFLATDNAVRKENSILLFRYYHQNNLLQSPFFLQQQQSPNEIFNQQKNNTEWFNRYPNIFSKLPNFVKKYSGGAGTTADDYVKIVCDGDSIFARETMTTAVSDPTSTPPTLVAQNIAKYIYDNLNLEKPIYRRYDYTSFFTETGSFGSVTNDATWDDSGDRPCHTRLSTDTNALIQFTVSSAYDRFNFIDRTDAAGTNNAIIAVTGGNGLLEVMEEGGIFAEANGYAFSQLEVDEGARRGNTIYQRRLYFKKVGTGVGASITLSISKGTADATRLLYWGVEMMSGAKPYNLLINNARGSHTLAMLYDYMDDDIIGRNPDLVLLQLPMINMLVNTWSKDYSVNWVQDFIWGDRVGYTNMWNLKTQSNDWTNFELLVVIPHLSRGHFNSDGTLLSTNGLSAQEIYNAVKKLFYDHNDVAFIDVSAAFLREIASDNTWTNIYNAMTGGVNAYTGDSVHQNDKGTLVYAKHICPIFDLNSL